MSDIVITNPGQVLSAGDAKALFLKLFTGEVLQTFQTECVTLPLVRTKTISGGKSAQFIVTGRVSGQYHVPGTEIGGQTVKNTEKVINIDDLFLVSTAHAEIYELMTQWDSRAPVSKEHGQALARQMDTDNFRVIGKAARSSANIAGTTYSGTVLNQGPTVASSAAIFLSSIEKAAQTFDEKDIAKDGRTCILRPAQYYLLLSDTTPKVANQFIRGGGNIQTADIGEYMGFRFIKSNRIPTGTTPTVSGENNDYSGDFTNTVALCFTSDAVARLTLMGIKTESEWQMNRQVTQMVSKYATGAGVLRPECAIEITKAASA